MESFNSTDGCYEGRPVASGSTPQNRSSARSSPPTKTSITRTGHARDVGAWVGLTPRRFQSGEMDYDGHIAAAMCRPRREP
jgi:hypothetical protein